jgi:uncharacterized protein YjbJ (UPF0337 family)
MEEIMDKDRIAGSAKQVKGAVNQAAGKVVGDAKLESEGQADKVEGKIQNAIGSLKDTLKGNRDRGWLRSPSGRTALSIGSHLLFGTCGSLGLNFLP